MIINLRIESAPLLIGVLKQAGLEMHSEMDWESI